MRLTHSKTTASLESCSPRIKSCLVFGLCIWDSVLWALVFGREFCILGFGLCTLNFGPWTWGFGFGILNFKLGTLGIGRWPLGFGL